MPRNRDNDEQREKIETMKHIYSLRYETFTTIENILGIKDQNSGTNGWKTRDLTQQENHCVTGTEPQKQKCLYY